MTKILIEIRTLKNGNKKLRLKSMYKEFAPTLVKFSRYLTKEPIYNNGYYYIIRKTNNKYGETIYMLRYGIQTPLRNKTEYMTLVPFVNMFLKHEHFIDYIKNEDMNNLRIKYM